MTEIILTIIKTRNIDGKDITVVLGSNIMIVFPHSKILFLNSEASTAIM